MDNSLKKKKDFENVLKRGRGFREALLFLKFTGNNLCVSRFGFIISGKVSKSAVVRNKIKRRLKDLARKELPQIKPGLDIVIIASKGIEEKTFKDLGKTFQALLGRAGIMRPAPLNSQRQ